VVPLAAASQRLHAFGAPTEILHGAGSTGRIGAEVERLGGRRVLLVSDQGLARAGIAGTVAAQLDRAGMPVESYLDVPVDPTFDDVDAVVAAVGALRADTVVAVGSGSVLAAGRAAAVAAPHDLPSITLAGTNRATRPPLLSVCVPTTAGSGGEVSRQATITDPSGHKSGISGWAVAARLAVLDPELLRSVPRRQAVASGVDALTHALEAYVSRRATPLTDALALPSFETIFRDLPLAASAAGAAGATAASAGTVAAALEPDVDLLDRLLLASAMANLACGNAGLGLVHGLNKGITYLFHARDYPGLSYGDLHAVLLPWVNAFNAEAAPARYATLARLMGVPAGLDDAAAATAGVERLKEWLDALDAPRRLPWDRCPPEDLDLVVGDVLGRTMAADNPRESSAGQLREIVAKCIVGW
jgi:alcohol dehydrogenase class IV